MSQKPLTKNEKALVGLNFLVLATLLGATPFIHPTIWYEPFIEAEKTSLEVQQGPNNRVFVIDAEIPADYEPLNVVASVDFTGEGFLGEECGNSHGVMVANVIGHETIGVNPNIPIVGVKIFECDIENQTQGWGFIKAIHWVEENSTAGDIVNLSLTAVDGRNTIVEETLERLTEKGITVVSSAGNYAGEDICDKAYGATVEGAHIISGIQPKGLIKNNVEKVEDFADGECVTGYMPGVEVRTYDISGKKRIVEGTSFSAAFKTGILSIGG